MDALTQQEKREIVRCLCDSIDASSPRHDFAKKALGAYPAVVLDEMRKDPTYLRRVKVMELKQIAQAKLQAQA